MSLVTALRKHKAAGCSKITNEMISMLVTRYIRYLRGCIGKRFIEFQETLIRRFRGPGAKWKRW